VFVAAVDGEAATRVRNKVAINPRRTATAGLGSTSTASTQTAR
jgi:hypothetical protein